MIRFDQEFRQDRKERLEEGARAAGVVLIETAQGERYVPIAEVEFAERAREMLRGRQPELFVVAPVDPLAVGHHAADGGDQHV